MMRTLTAAKGPLLLAARSSCSSVVPLRRRAATWRMKLPVPDASTYISGTGPARLPAICRHEARADSAAGARRSIRAAGMAARRGRAADSLLPTCRDGSSVTSPVPTEGFDGMDLPACLFEANPRRARRPRLCPVTGSRSYSSGPAYGAVAEAGRLGHAVRAVGECEGG